MLIQTLRNLERDGLLERTVYRQVPPKTEYRLTDNGHKLREPIAWLCEWGMSNQEKPTVRGRKTPDWASRVPGSFQSLDRSPDQKRNAPPTLIERSVLRQTAPRGGLRQRLAQWKKLIGTKPDTGAERGLQEIAVGRRRGAPADRNLARGVLVR
jgi:HxlR-like helix-turn-helix